MLISELYIHPLKSAAAIRCEHLDIEPRGARDDRRWMLVDEHGRFITARVLPGLVRLQALPRNAGLQLCWQDQTIEVAEPAATAPRIGVTVWKSTLTAALAEPSSQHWLSERLGRDVRLVFMDAAAQRLIAPGYVPDEVPVSFADGFPLLLIGQASLDDLNSRLKRPVGMRNFRPNLVVSNADAFAEDGWRRLRIGTIEFAAVKPCTRCVFTTIDPETAQRADDGEPLATLKTYRSGALGVTFGMNLVALGRGRIGVGDRVTVLG